MKRISLPIMGLALLAPFLILPGPAAHAQTLLWKLQDPAGKQGASYAYGTMHVADSAAHAYSRAVPEAIASCDAFFAELALDEVNPMSLMQQLMMPGDTTVYDVLPEAQTAVLDSLLKDQLGLGLMPFQRLQPIFFYVMLTEDLAQQKNPQAALDYRLLRFAENQGLQTGGLETAEEQVTALTNLPLAQQGKLLSSGLAMVVDTTGAAADAPEAEATDRLMRYYTTGALDSLLLMMEADTSSTEMQAFMEPLVGGRNRTMATRMAREAQQQPTFFAIGAAHLPGKDGVLALLREQGFVVTPVPNPFDGEGHVLVTEAIGPPPTAPGEQVNLMDLMPGQQDGGTIDSD